MEISHRRRVALASGGDGGFRDTFLALEQKRALLAKVNEDGSFSALALRRMGAQAPWERLAASETARGGKEEQSFME